MASVLDRPLFQKKATESRDRLKQLGNIGSYDFGEALPVQAQPDFSQSMDVFQDTMERAAQDAVPPASTIPKVVTPTSQNKRYVIGRAVFIKKPNGIVTYENGDPIDIGQAETIRGIIAQQDRSAGQDLAQRNENALTGMYEGKFPVSKKALQENPSGLPPSPMEEDARNRTGRTLTPEGAPVVAAKNKSGVVSRPDSGPAPVAAKAAEKPMGQTTMEADARGRKPMAITPADVAAGLNDPTPEVREKTAADFAKQFTDMGPKYEGIDKGLLLAQIGFAIAAGESPNAMKNIADGLSLGADTAIKDKAAKAEFDRQIQLSAMQYGLGEAGKLETEKRAMAREGKAGSFFVADKDVTFGGRKYSAGDNVFVPNSQLWEGGLPAGLSTESSYSAFQTAQATVQKALIEAEKNNVLDGDQYKMVMTGVNDAADSYGQAAKMLPILEASLLRAANGEVTGFVPALQTAFNQAANAFGLKPEASYSNKEQYTSDLQKVTVKMVGDILGEGGKTISDNDRRIATEITATMNDLKSGIISDPDIVVSKIQDLMKTLEGNQQKAVDLYSTYMKDYGSTTTMSGAPFGSIYADRIFQTPTLSYTVGDDGIYRITTEGQ